MPFAGSKFHLMWKIHYTMRVDIKHIEDMISALTLVGGQTEDPSNPKKELRQKFEKDWAWLKIVCVTVAPEEKDNEITKENISCL